MNYSQINTTDVVNGRGVRVSLFVSGCTIHCKGCFNPDAWNFCYGSSYTNETESEILQGLNHPYIKGLSILGGEPYDQDPAVLVSLVEKVRIRRKTFGFGQVTSSRTFETILLLNLLMSQCAGSLRSTRGMFPQRILSVDPETRE